VKDQSFRVETIEAQKLGHKNLVFKGIYCPIFNVLRFMTSTSLLLALNGMMVVIFGFILYRFTIVPPLLLAAFLVTLGVYSLNKVTDKAEDAVNRPETLQRSSNRYLVFSVISMITGFLIGLLEGVTAFIILFSPVIIGVIYSVKISKSIPRLKEIVGVKSLVIAGSWAITGCLLPESISAEKLQATIIIFVYIFIRVLVGAILCDVLDNKGDLASGIQTIPTKIGKSKTKKLLILMNSFELLLLVYCILTGMFIQFIPALIFGVLYGYLAIWFFFKDSCKRFTAGLMLDGEWLPIVIIVCLIIR
jgi:4-hydroxybenzoate polyprenyltransferase